MHTVFHRFFSFKMPLKGILVVVLVSTAWHLDVRSSGCCGGGWAVRGSTAQQDLRVS